MGTSWSAILITEEPQDASTLASLQAAVVLEIDRLEDILSTWRPESDLSRWNDTSSTEPQQVPEELVAVVRVALAVAQASGGALDPTVAPAVEAWGFAASAPQPTPPTEGGLALLQERIGFERVTTGSTTLSKSHPELTLDLSAIAKGWAVDRVSDLLVARGYRDTLVEIGGELVARGENAAGHPWQLAIERPVRKRSQRPAGLEPIERAIHTVIGMRDGALATSGDYRNWRIIGGKRVSHTIDPRTLHPIRHRLASVSVMAQDCATADAWATALNVMGPRHGFEMAKHHKIAAFFLTYTDDTRQQVEVWRSPEWIRRVDERAAQE